MESASVHRLNEFYFAVDKMQAARLDLMFARLIVDTISGPQT